MLSGGDPAQPGFDEAYAALGRSFSRFGQARTGDSFFPKRRCGPTLAALSSTMTWE